MLNKGHNVCGRVLIAVLLRAVAAGATPLDDEGERGPELELRPGLGSFATESESLFRSPEMLLRPEIAGSTLAFGANNFGSNFSMSVALGYRFAPFVSAGAVAGYQFLHLKGAFSEADLRTTVFEQAHAVHAGVYGRVYPMAFFNGSRRAPQVRFESWADRRRFDPWFSIGVNLTSVSRSRTFPDHSVAGSTSEFTTNYLGIPLAVGLDYRLVPRLAVGLNFGVTPLVGGTTTLVDHHVDRTTGVPVVTDTSTTYAPSASANALLFIGLGLRYTFTYW